MRKALQAILVAAGVTGSLVVAANWLLRPRPVAEADVASRPIQVEADGYVSSSTCRACHPHEHATWHASYHRSMTQRADQHAVLADWRGELTHAGQTWRLERRGEQFWIDMADPLALPGTTPHRVQHQVVMTTGSHNMQVYWFESGAGRITGLLPFSWQIAERRWIPRHDSFVLPATDPNPGFGAWSLVCSKCHATHSRPRLDFENNDLRGGDSHVGEFGIGCESCHGPGRAHIDRHRSPTSRYAARANDGPDPTITDPRRLPFDRATMVCGQCHGQFDYRFTTATMHSWFQNGFRYRPGDDVQVDRTVKFAGDEQFWSDGLIRVAGREYNAVVRSRCHTQGHMTCFTCHALHQPPGDARPASEWANDQLHAGDLDRSCSECHAKVAAAGAAHTHHAAGSEGSRCVNCHMPHTTYGLMKGVRTHQIDSPNVAVSVATGRPNACNQCHLDRSQGWAAEHLQSWYGIKKPQLPGDEATVAAGAQWALKGNAAQRALMAWSFGWAPARAAAGTDWMAPYLAKLLDDPYGAVRIIASRSLRTLPGYDDVTYDPASDVAGRQAVADVVLGRWQQTPRPPAARPAVLLGEGGALDVPAFARLLRARDLRPITLIE
jgi:hypothetical protein